MTVRPFRPSTSNLLEQDAYFSIDVETDGPIPGPFSMLAMGIVAAGHHDGRRYQSPDDWGLKRYWELRPTGSRYEAEALAVNGLDRTKLLTHGEDPAVVMSTAAAWIIEQAGGRRPVMVASPAGFDWMFVHHYFVTFTGASPFGHSGLLDIKTALAVKFSRPIAQSGRERVPSWLGAQAHTHNALDDAFNQARLFASVMEWRGPSMTAAF